MVDFKYDWGCGCWLHTILLSLSASLRSVEKEVNILLVWNIKRSSVVFHMTAHNIAHNVCANNFSWNIRPHDKIMPGHPWHKGEAALLVTNGCTPVSELMTPMAEDNKAIAIFTPGTFMHQWNQPVKLKVLNFRETYYASAENINYGNKLIDDLGAICRNYITCTKMTSCFSIL